MHTCYARFAQRYSGIIHRSLPDMRLKLADYASDGAKALGIYEGAFLRGYCVYFVREESYAEEFAANDTMCAEALLRALCREAAQTGKEIRGKLPPDTRFSESGIAARVRLDLRPMGVMGVADVSALLRAVCGVGAYRVEVTDGTVSANNGVFNFAGNRTDKAPHVRLEAGRLAQFLCGYHTLAELEHAGHADVFDPVAVRELDAAFPPQICYIVDEY